MNQSISILSSSIENGPYKNLGGPPSFVVGEDSYLNGMFHWDSIHGAEVFNILYLKNSNYSQLSINLDAAVEVRIEKTLISDIILQKYLHYLSVDIFIPSYVTKNYQHPAITPDGYFIDSYPKKITDFVDETMLNRSIVFIDGALAPGEFMPIVIRLKLDGPLGIVFKLPVVLNTYVGVF